MPRRNRRPPRRPIRGGGASAFAIVLVVGFLSTQFTPLILAHMHIRLRRINPKPIDQNDIFAGLVEENIGWRGKLAMKHLRSLFSEKVLDVITANTNSSGPLSLDSFRINLSDSWKTFGLQTSMENRATSPQNDHKDKLDIPFHSYSNFTPEDLNRMQLRAERREKRAADLIQQDDRVSEKLEKEAIQRVQSVDSAALGKYSLWKNEKENTGTLVLLMQDQIIMARVYLGIANKKERLDIAKAIENQIEESLSALGEATADADLPSSAHKEMKAMGQVLSEAREHLYDSRLINKKLRAMVQTEGDLVMSLRKQNTFLSQLVTRSFPKGIHCLSLLLTVDYYHSLPPKKIIFQESENLENPKLYHYALFSDNVLAASVVVNSAITNAKEPEKHVFHIATDTKNFGAMKMWFLLNPPGKATIDIENFDEFKWLNSSYCPVLRQAESATMKEFYFKPDNSTTLQAASENLKFKNPKYLSMLNHLRFYLPQIYPKLEKILFLDDDVVVQQDLTELWRVDLHGKVNGAVETCGEVRHRFNDYLNFSNPLIASNFDPNACGWAYGMNIFDLNEWRNSDITGIYHKWQNLNEDRGLWQLGSLPPALIAFYGLTEPINKNWHLLKLGYDGGIRPSAIEKAAVVHFNGNMKPWLEFAIAKYRPYWTKYVKLDDVYINKCKLVDLYK